MVARLVQTLGKEYLVEFPKDRWFPRISRVDKVPASGILANTMEELTGRPQEMNIYILPEEEEEVAMVLSLGRRWSKRPQWQSMVTWAEMCKNNEVFRWT